jgi:hypothetical protein
MTVMGRECWGLVFDETGAVDDEVSSFFMAVSPSFASVLGLGL